MRSPRCRAQGCPSSSHRASPWGSERGEQGRPLEPSERALQALRPAVSARRRSASSAVRQFHEIQGRSTDAPAGSQRAVKPQKKRGGRALSELSRRACYSTRCAISTLFSHSRRVSGRLEVSSPGRWCRPGAAPPASWAEIPAWASRTAGRRSPSPGDEYEPR